MIKTTHLESYRVTLTAVTPVSTGSGAEINKKEYSYSAGDKTVSIIDMAKFMKAVVEKKIIDEYESMILSDLYKGGMYEFLHKFFSKEEIAALTIYSCGAEIYDKNQAMMSIRGFSRMANGMPYIAGSSLKGALHTCLLVNRILKNRAAAERIVDDMYNNAAKNDKAERRAESFASENIGIEYINTLKLIKDKNYRYSNAVNSEMRSLSVSDSAPIDVSESMTLCRKCDVNMNGDVNKINVLRECIKPKTEVTFNITFDKRIRGITCGELAEAIKSFSLYYGELLRDRFVYPSDSLQPSCENRLLMGAGVGYFSKTCTYAAQPYEEALKTARYIMEREFSTHYHGTDVKISPRMLKFTEYDGKLMPMGLCDIRFE